MFGSKKKRSGSRESRPSSSSSSSSRGSKEHNLRGSIIQPRKIKEKDSGKGTGTTQQTRNYANDPKTERPDSIEGIAASKGESHRVHVPNPKTGKSDAGHIVGKQLGGSGRNPANIMPQNPDYNRGNNGQRDWTDFERDSKKMIEEKGEALYTIKKRRPQ
jgi:hypothetical protein